MRTIDELIAESPTFAGLDQAHLELIAGCGWNQQLTAGTLLMREGDAADHFFLIRHGLVTLELYAPGVERLQIQTLDEGDVVGWSWLFAPHRWQLDCRAIGDCRVVTFDGACLRGKCEEDHELGYQLMSRFAANVINRLQETRLQLLDVYGRAPASA
jgi:CRP/FNR family transcriptional regulator, cyclic AMP receptor protein